MQQRPSYNRGPSTSSTPASVTPTVLDVKPAPKPMHVKKVTLTSKKNWWMVEMDEEDEPPDVTMSSNFSSSEETAVDNLDVLYNYDHHPSDVHSESKVRTQTPATTQPIYTRNPHSLFSFPTPIAYTAPKGPSNPTASLSPCAHGSASELFKCIVKKPDVVQLEINGEMQSNASDVTVQFLAELRVYTSLARHRNVCAFLGSLENVGMVLEYIDGRTLYDVVIARPPLTPPKKRDYHNQLLDGLTHLHSYGLSHGDLSLLNIQVTTVGDTVKLLDFGRSVSASSTLISPHGPPVDPFAPRAFSAVEIETIHPGTRPFSAPEVLRGECVDARLADAYSFGMILVCLDRCESVDVKPWDQRKDKLPSDLFDGCEVFEERAREYLRKWDAGRRRLKKEDMMVVGT
ncbi:Protein kinase domain-containing protein [Mycena indigotica]|uniref:Protein kinase domain-containing protein n=1 Tax=Mycena indigotica TaxID=2126181 RepID=A0A8H6TEA0_9AGAR|nr:Protein kinase domain-containing protein [Mycena indigotica]KAF7315801.1 Protein kinase domain-containing protein [Mycena indigotica]